MMQQDTPKPRFIQPEPCLNTGIHIGRSYNEVAETASRYYFWNVDADLPGKHITEYLDWVERHYEIDEEIKIVWLKGTEKPGRPTENASNVTCLLPHRFV